MLIFLSTTTLSEDDKKFLENLYVKQGRRMWFIAVSILKDKEKAEDAVQSSFIRLIKKASLLRSFNDINKINAYIYAVIKNKSLDVLNRERKYRFVDYYDLENKLSSVKDVETVIFNNYELEIIKEEISKLKPIYRDALQMRFILGLSYDDITNRYDITNENARFRFSHGLKLLKSAIAEKCRDD